MISTNILCSDMIIVMLVSFIFTHRLPEIPLDYQGNIKQHWITQKEMKWSILQGNILITDILYSDSSN